MATIYTITIKGLMCVIRGLIYGREIMGEYKDFHHDVVTEMVNLWRLITIAHGFKCGILYNNNQLFYYILKLMWIPDVIILLSTCIIVQYDSMSYDFSKNHFIELRLFCAIIIKERESKYNINLLMFSFPFHWAY